MVMATTPLTGSAHAAITCLVVRPFLLRRNHGFEHCKVPIRWFQSNKVVAAQLDPKQTNGAAASSGPAVT